jgi:hypothetical protein
VLKLNRKSQVAAEAAMIISFMTLAFIIFFFAISDQFISISENKRDGLVTDLGTVIQAEISLAATAADGYYRTLLLPSTLNGMPYNISLFNATALNTNFSVVVINVSGYQHVINLPKATGGNISTGQNTIVKARGNITVSSS